MLLAGQDIISLIGVDGGLKVDQGQRFQVVREAADFRDGSMEFRSTVIHPQWGEGGLFGVTLLLPEGDNLRANARAVLTWPALSRNQVYKNTEDFDLNTNEN